MRYRQRPWPALLAAALLASSQIGMAATTPPATASHWTTVVASSRIMFTATQAGGDFDGQFHRFQADVTFDPADLAGSRLEVEIETGSADTGDTQRDTTLSGPDFFSVERWKTATWTSAAIRPAGAGQYEAQGQLTIRGVMRPVPVTFAYRPAKDGRSAALTGSATLRRLDFGVGQGQWQDTEWVGNEVRIRFELVLKK